MSDEAGTTDAKEMNLLQRWIGIYFSPGKTFESIKAKPDWVLPLLILGVVSTIGAIVLMPVIYETGIQSVMQSQDLTYDEAQAQMAQGKVFMTYGVPIWGFLSAFVIAFIVAGVFYGVNNFILGGESTYKTVLSAYSYSALGVGTIGAIVNIPLMLAKNSMVAPVGPAAFLSPEMKDEFIYKFLAKLDVFSIWMAILLIIAFGVIYKFSQGKAAVSVVGLWLIWILVSASLGM